MPRSHENTLSRRNNRRNGIRMDPVKFPFRSSTRPGIKNPSYYYSKQFTKSNLIFYTSIALFIVFLCYIFMFSSSTSNSNYSLHKKYGIVIDGGSTGTRIHVFEYLVNNGGKKLEYSFGGKEGGLASSMKVNPGLSAHENEPDKAGEAIGELVEFGRKIVPREYWWDTEIRLMATAGLRMLNKEAQDKILDSCRKVLRSSGFRFQDNWASVISGSDEGVYAWVIANYALRSLGGDPQKTTGIIELGGASAQVTFVSDEHLPPEFSRTVRFGNYTYNLYSHSLLQFGQNVAFELLRESLVTRGRELATGSLQSGKPIDPCTPRGFAYDTRSEKLSPSYMAEKDKYLSNLHPNGNFTECRSASLNLLQKDKERCSYRICEIGANFIPKLQGKFLATENFFHTSKFFGLGPRVYLSDLMAAGRQFCEEDWLNLKRKYNSLDDEELLRYCFSSAYIVDLLHDSLGISLEDERIGYANQVENIPLDWALGAFILQSKEAVDTETSPHSMGSPIVGDTSTLLLLVGIMLVSILAATYFTRCRNPQLKTIYDLEKGKYIVTRVSRYS